MIVIPVGGICNEAHVYIIVLNIFLCHGFRIINKNPEFLAPSHGCVIQNRAIMRYTLFVV